MRYYGEYIDANGKFQNMFFDNWQDWWEVNFDPRCTILVVRDTMSKYISFLFLLHYLQTRWQAAGGFFFTSLCSYTYSIVRTV